MKLLRILTFIHLLVGFGYCGQNTALIKAIEQVESCGRIDAVGDNGKAVGCLQIHKIMVDDINRIVGKDKYTYQDRLNRQKSYEMAEIYFTHYCKNMTDDETIACWNAGPKGNKYLKTNKNVQNYVKKVEQHLAR